MRRRFLLRNSCGLGQGKCNKFSYFWLEDELEVAPKYGKCSFKLRLNGPVEVHTIRQTVKRDCVLKRPTTPFEGPRPVIAGDKI